MRNGVQAVYVVVRFVCWGAVRLRFILIFVYFSSSRGRNFKVRVSGPKAFGGAALMGQEEAMTMSGFLLQAKKYAALVNKKINP